MTSAFAHVSSNNLGELSVGESINTIQENIIVKPAFCWKVLHEVLENEVVDVEIELCSFLARHRHLGIRGQALNLRNGGSFGHMQIIHAGRYRRCDRWAKAFVQLVVLLQ
jgi:hypothetical protein